jgi:predicted transcriptional regulator
MMRAEIASFPFSEFGAQLFSEIVAFIISFYIIRKEVPHSGMSALFHFIRENLLNTGFQGSVVV